MKQRYDPPEAAPPTAKAPLGQLLDRRNQSLLAHGSEPVEQKDATALYEQVTAILEKHLEAERFTLAEMLQPSRFLRCPWV